MDKKRRVNILIDIIQFCLLIFCITRDAFPIPLSSYIYAHTDITEDFLLLVTKSPHVRNRITINMVHPWYGARLLA